MSQKERIKQRPERTMITAGVAMGLLGIKHTERFRRIRKKYGIKYVACLDPRFYEDEVQAVARKYKPRNGRAK